MNASTGSDYALWLMLDADSTERLRALQARLAREWGGPAFAPHVTLRSRLTHGEAEGTLDNLAGSRFVLELSRLRLGPAPFQALVLDVADPAPIDALRVQLGGLAAAPQPPHVSLYYGPAPREIPGWLGETLDSQAPWNVQAAAVALWDLRDTVTAWRECRRRPLTAAAV